MDSNTQHNSPQYGLATLLKLTTCFCVFCSVAAWIIRSEHLGTLSDIPMPFIVPISLMFYGIVLLPFACLGIACAILVCISQSKPRPYTASLFFGFAALTLALEGSFWDDSLRLLVAVTLSALAMVVEALTRKLPNSQLAAAMLAVIYCFGFYVFLITAVCSAAV